MKAEAPEDLLERCDPGAPMVLVTGLPGAGKTLYALATFAVGKGGVYQHGVPGCTLPSWDPTKWQEMPPGSTLIVDEAQEVFPPRPPTSDPPGHYVFNKIRHGGRAVVLITQHPSMLDARVRRLAGRHLHLVNAFGMEAATVHEWRGSIGDPDTRSGSTSSLFRYPKKVFALYKSSALHRGRASVPWKVKLIPIMAVAAVALLGGGGYLVWQRMADLANGRTAGKVAAPERPAGGSGTPGPAAGVRSPDQLDPAAYVAQFQPRVAGLPHTAPRFDEATKASHVPYPAACIKTTSRCECFTQQGTRMTTPAQLCETIVRDGFFLDFDPEGEKAVEGRQASREAPPARPAEPDAVPGLVGLKTAGMGMFHRPSDSAK